MKGVVLHGGAGSRLRPLTHTGPKQLIPVANKPISQYVLEDLVKSDICDICIVLGDTYPEKVKEWYSDGSRFSARLAYVYQGEPKGIAHAVSLCREFVGDNAFVVYLGDNLLKGGIKKFVHQFSNSSYDAMVLLCKVEEPQRFGVAEFDRDNRLVGLVEKPKTPPSNYALTGIYFFRPVIFEMIRDLRPSWRGELEITDAIHLLLSRGHEVGFDYVMGWWKDTGTPEDILEANRLILDDLKAEIRGKVEDSASIQGRVSIGRNSIVRSGSLIRGPVIVGDDTEIGKGVYIGPYTSIGSSVTVKRGEIENTILMDNCVIEANERVVDSLISSHSSLTSSEKSKPKGRRFILGERSQVIL